MCAQRMFLSNSQCLLVAVLPIAILFSWGPQCTGAENLSKRYQATVGRFVEKYCADCHRGDEPEGDFSLGLLASDPRAANDLAAWKKVFGHLQSSAMPPMDAGQPTLEDRLQVMDWIRRTLSAAGSPVDESKARDSGRGNWVDHTALFSGKPAGNADTPSRVWRITDDAYDAYSKRLSAGGERSLRVITPPWRLPAQWSFPDYSTAHRVGEPEIEVHMRSSARIAKHLISLFPKKKEFAPLAEVGNQGDPATSD